MKRILIWVEQAGSKCSQADACWAILMRKRSSWGFSPRHAGLSRTELLNPFEVGDQVLFWFPTSTLLQTQTSENLTEINSKIKKEKDMQSTGPKFFLFDSTIIKLIYQIALKVPKNLLSFSVLCPSWMSSIQFTAPIHGLTDRCAGLLLQTQLPTIPPKFWQSRSILSYFPK